MKKIFYKVLTITVIVFTLFSFTAFALPLDVGNTNDYSGGGDSDWGGGSWGGGSDWSSDYSSDDSELSDSPFMTIVIVGFIFVVVIFAMAKKSGNTNVSQGGNTMPIVSNNTQMIVPEIQKIDPRFNPEKFLAWTKEVFITLQNAWTERDWSKIRSFEKEELYKQHETQLNEYKRLQRINIIDRITVNQAYLNFYKRDSDYEYLKVYFQVRMGDYIIDENTKEVIKGDPATDYQLSYLLSFMRKKGVLTNEISNKSTTSCPNCGAPTQVTSAGECEYCNSIITSGNFDWVLYDLQAVKPGISIDNSGVNIIE